MSKSRMRLDGKALLQSARALVAGPLRFGDTEQIKAARFLADAQEHYEHLIHCPKCFNWEECPRGMTGHFDIEDAAWAMVEAAGGIQGIAETALLNGETHL